MDRWKAEMGRVREKRRVEERRSEKRKSQKKEDADARKGRKVAKHCVFPMIWEMKNCTPLWREAHFEVKMYKTHHSRTTFGSWDVEKVHAVVARSTFPKSKCTKHTMYGPLLDVQISFRVAGARDCAPCQKWTKREGFVAFPKTMARGGTFEEDLQRCIFRGRRSTRDIWHHFFVAGAMLSTRGLEKSQNALVRGCQLCTQLSIFEGRLPELLCFWCCQIQKFKTSVRIASFWMLSSSKKWRSLAELLRFWCCQFRKMRMPRRRASFSSLQKDR